MSSTLASPVSAPAGTRRLATTIGGYVALTKPRIIELLLVSTVPTMIVANAQPGQEGGLPSIWLMLATVVGGTLSAGGANAINMYVDRDIDALMDRTKGRPLVTGVMSPRAALIFAVALEVVAFAFLWAFVNLLSAVLAVSACLFYVFVYTLWLKRTSERNIVIGGAAGAAPVLIGWSAVTDGLAWAPVVLFGLMFFWTPPHFWALAIKYKDDYAKADVPMLPSVADHATVARKILAYTVVVVAFSLAFAPFAHLGLVYLVSAVVLGAVFLRLAVMVRRTESPKVVLRRRAARRADHQDSLLIDEAPPELNARALQLFTYSITYVTLLFGAMAADALIGR